MFLSYANAAYLGCGVVDRNTPQWSIWSLRPACELRQGGVAGLCGSLTGIRHSGVLGSEVVKQFSEKYGSTAVTGRFKAASSAGSDGLRRIHL